MGKVKDRKRAKKAASLKARRVAKEGTPSNAGQLKRELADAEDRLAQEQAMSLKYRTALQEIETMLSKTRSKDGKLAHEAAVAALR